MAIKDDELIALYVLPEYQNQGLGALLMEQGKQHRPYLFSYIMVCDPYGDAVDFYRSHGFRISRERKDPLSRCDEYLMEYRRA
jgi:ribosomal protein S18 acetylase RimI-like enzyme